MITLSIIIPMYNEEARIGIAIRALKTYQPPAGVGVDRVIFVDDGSSDQTVAKAKNAIIPYEKIVIESPVNHGRGYALRTAIEEATGDYALWLDVDMSTPLSMIQTFLPSMKKGIPVIVGSRKILGADVPIRQPLYRIIMGQAFSKMSAVFLNVPIGDFTCGFKMFSRSAYQAIFPFTTINGWGNDSESLFLAQKFGYKINEIPIHWENDPRTKVKVVRDTFISLMDLLTIRFNSVMGVYTQYPNISVAGEGI